MAVGISEFEAKVPLVKGGGKAIMVSDPNNLFFVMSLNSKEYPFEKVGYFGDLAIALSSLLTDAFYLLHNGVNIIVTSRGVNVFAV